MAVVKTTIFVLLVYSADAWLRRRRRRCTPRACEVSQWSSWSSCSADKCGQQGSQRRSRTEVSAPSCGGTGCPELDETRLCYSDKREDCQLSSWSRWSVCSTQCGVSGTQSSNRHRIIIEQCGGTCTSTFRKTRACPSLSCLNGGSLEDKTCFCKKGHSGVCCETRSCYLDTPVDCQLSSWSKWSACSTPCGVSGTQSSNRHRIIIEQCGGTCTSTFRKTRACPNLSCLNGGSLEDKTCFCKKGYSGVCCEKEKKDSALAIGVPCGVVIFCLFAFFGIIAYKKHKNRIRPGNTSK